MVTLKNIQTILLTTVFQRDWSTKTTESFFVALKWKQLGRRVGPNGTSYDDRRFATQNTVERFFPCRYFSQYIFTKKPKKYICAKTPKFSANQVYVEPCVQCQRKQFFPRGRSTVQIVRQILWYTSQNLVLILRAWIWGIRRTIPITFRSAPSSRPRSTWSLRLQPRPVSCSGSTLSRRGCIGQRKQSTSSAGFPGVPNLTWNIA